MDAIGCDPIEQQYVFSEICHRQRNRWDMRLPTSDPAWAQLGDAAVAAATPVIREAQGAAAFRGVLPLMSGVVVSRPGARVQRFHVDATHSHFAAAEADPTHRIYNIFVPLVDVLGVATARSSGRRSTCTRAHGRSRGTSWIRRAPRLTLTMSRHPPAHG